MPKERRRLSMELARVDGLLNDLCSSKGCGQTGTLINWSERFRRSVSRPLIESRLRHAPLERECEVGFLSYVLISPGSLTTGSLHRRNAIAQRLQARLRT